MELIKLFDDKIIVLETIKYKKLKVYRAVQNGLGIESISRIGSFKYSNIRKEWVFYPAINYLFTGNVKYLNSLSKALEELNKKW